MYKAVAFTCTLILCGLLRRWLGKRTSKLPPGPSALPILGSVHHLTLEYQHKTFLAWGKTYGVMIYFRLFRTPTVVLNSLEGARDLLDKRSAKYSDRPRLVLLSELLGHDLSIAAMPYGDRFRKHRKLMHDGVGSKSALQRYRPIKVREAHILLRNLLDTPEAFLEHLYRYVAATLLEITYGRRLTSMDDELVQLAEHWINATNDGGSPGSMLVDFFPVLRHMPTWMPGAGFKRRAAEVRSCLHTWRETALKMVIDAMATGEAAPSITASLLEAHQGNPTPEELEDIQYIGVSIYGAGMETTYGTLTSFMLAMVRNPGVVQKAQEELDRVVGPDRLPDFGDRESLPYLNAVLEELYRWNPGLPLSIPHRVMSDDEYRGYDIPAGCMIMPNIWAMTRNTDHFPDPEEFIPERHLREAKLMDAKELPSSFVFGFGRRVCPGQAFADGSVWLALARIIAAFDIRKPVDAAGNEYTPPAAFKPGFTSQPKHFECRIVPRSEKVAVAISQLTV
ncbi:cytochrome P450 [Fomes fomentarius]|nr:cytochrome P450 [Fomes fomentarius]